MPTEFTINVAGIEQVTAALTKMPDRLVKNAFARALAASAVPIVEALKPRTPVDTGLLQSSIMADIQIDPTGKGGELAVGFGKQGYIARFVEFGTRHTGHKPLKKYNGVDIKPTSFMRKSAATSADASVEAFASSIKTSVDSGL